VLHYTGLGNVCQGQTLYLIEPICKLQRKNNCEYAPRDHIKKSFIFIVPYEWAQEAEVLHYTKLERFARDKPSILLFPFVKYKKMVKSTTYMSVDLRRDLLSHFNRCRFVPTSNIHSN